MRTQQIQRVLDFNRFYTSVIGLLEGQILECSYSLPEARVLYELYNHQPCMASLILTTIRLDKGYLSRILKSLERRGLMNKKQSRQDGRVTLLALTAKGNREFDKINTASTQQITAILSSLSKNDVEEYDVPSHE
jgi:DNA-binding MarR family transcriptional regulator